MKSLPIFAKSARVSVRKGSLLVLGLTLLCAGCSTPSSADRVFARQEAARPSTDTYSSELFYLGQESGPERPVKHWEFFNKDCEIARRNRMLGRNEWQCSER